MIDRYLLWVEGIFKNWLLSRGYWIIPAGVPMLVVSNGVGVMEKLPDGGKRYTIHMPAGHKLMTVNYSFISEEQ